MLIRSNWTLTVDEPTVLPRTYGLELVKNLHQRMSLEMGNETISSVTFSGIIGFYSVSGNFITFRPDEFYQLSLLVKLLRQPMKESNRFFIILQKLGNLRNLNSVLRATESYPGAIALSNQSPSNPNSDACSGLHLRTLR
ncbi:hypothetical protein LC593_25685 [Nostoc sp. CHAB 5844]|nr:hypothetical protein [Nostoc sp. CHAB 5844]